MTYLRNIFQAIFVRLILLLHSGLTIWRAATIQNNHVYWCLGFANIFVIIELIYRVFKRKGNESKWFCPCFLFYLCSTLPAILILEIDKLQTYDIKISTTNVSRITEETLIAIGGITLPIALEPEVWINLLEQMLIFILIIGRWLLPRGKLTRHQLSQLLFMFLGAGSDILELFIVFEEAEVRRNKTLSYIVLTVWSASLLQFTFVFTAIKNPKQNCSGDTEKNAPSDDKKTKVGLLQRLFGTEIWSLLLSMAFMDLPFLCIRLYVLITMHIIAYGILFFTCKNIIMILIVIYRVTIICVGNGNDDSKAELGTVTPSNERD